MTDDYNDLFAAGDAAASEGRIAELEELIRSNRALYYNDPESDALIEDEVFDAYVDELRDLDPTNTVLTEVGADPKTTGGWTTEAHAIPMASLDKVNTVEQTRDWVGKRRCGLFCVQEKMDGFSISCDYVDGKLTRVLTRGGGVTGENITRNAVKIRGIPNRLPTNFTGTLRAEALFVLPEFNAYNEKAATEGWHVYKNRRNGASGLARKHSGLGCEYLRAFFYDMVSEKLSFSTHFEMMMFLRKRLSLWTPWFARVDLEGLETVYTTYDNAKRDGMIYEIDGLVIKVDSFKEAQDIEDTLQTSTNATANPKHQMAWKFEDETRVTTLLAIVGDFGLGGRVTPVAHLAPVQIGGVTVSKASVHNWDMVADLGLTIGCQVLIKRANEVIPQVIRAVNQTDQPVVVPTECPKCTGDLTVRGKFIECHNVHCEGVIAGNIRKWIRYLEVDFFGMSYIEALVAAGKLTTVADLYKLTPQDFTDADLGSGIAKRALTNLHAKGVVPLYMVFASLNITGFGRSLSKLLVESGLDTVDAMLNASITDMAGVQKFGTERATTVWNGFRKWETVIRELQDLITIQAPQAAQVVGGPLNGSVFCITGTLSQGKKVFEAQILAAGGGYESSLRSSVTHLIAADANGTSGKLTKARKKGVTVIDEAGLKALIAG